jgi:LuxR family maltose regulon positive regulatory protein
VISTSESVQGKAPPAAPAGLLETKLHPPLARAQAVVRDRLLDRLRPEPGVKLLLVAAPAGCGKTTLLGMWRELESERRPVAWVTLDEGDDDAVVLWSHVLEALRRVCPEIDVPAVPEHMAAARVLDALLPRLVNTLADQGDAALVLDDFHRLSGGPARDSVTWFVEHAPSTFQLVVSSRSEPALPLAALRAHGQLLEVRADALGFTADEAHALLNDRLELGLARDEIDGLVERTEGWPAGLYLAALSLQGVEDRHAFVSRFGGTNRYVVDFLVDEVLDAHDEAAQELMLRTSILDRLCGPLCDALLDRQGSAELLAELSRTNLFLLPLEGHGGWFRFHPLFAQLLRVELEHREPGLAPALHRRAFTWHRDHGSVDEAIGHALEADDFAEATEMIAGTWLVTASRGRHATVLGWVDRFPPALAREEPELLLIRAWMHSLSGQRREATDAIDALERVGWPEGKQLTDGSPSLEASLATMKAGFPWDDVAGGYEHARRAAELQTPDSPVWPGVCWALAMGCYYRGDPDEADRHFAEAVETGPPAERWLIAASGLAYRSFIAGDRGNLDEQRMLAQEAAELARERGVDEIRGEVHVALGAARAASGEVTEAVPLLARGVSILRASGGAIQLANALIHEAAVLSAAGDRSGARAALAEARATVEACPDPGILSERLAEIEQSARTPPRRRDGDAALSERERIILRMLGGPLSERDIGRELYLSHNTVHSHARSIYRKLGVSSRAEALARARELGLLSPR